MTFFADKYALEEMLSVSRDDFRNWEKTKKLSYLRDAANKLVGVAENMTSARLLKAIDNWGEFRHCFLKEYKDQDMLLRLETLHKFFYQGLGYDEPTQSIEYNYHKAYKFLQNNVKKFERERVRV